jgi:undecaprenyl diphosphate synthase
MHGAGGYRAQCGLVEGALMFIGVIGKARGLSNEAVVQACTPLHSSSRTNLEVCYVENCIHRDSIPTTPRTCTKGSRVTRSSLTLYTSPTSSRRKVASPNHIAFIMDGNGRWARQRGMPRSAGHKAGFEHIPDVLEACHDLGVQVVSAYAWSTENWGRAKAEVDYIVHSLERHLLRFVKELHKRGVRFVHSGSRDNLTERSLQVLDEAAEMTTNDGPEIFNLAFNYGGRAELAHVASEMVAAGMHPEAVSEAVVNDHL